MSNNASTMGRRIACAAALALCVVGSAPSAPWAQTHVNFEHSGWDSDGSPGRPFNTLKAGVTAAPEGSQVIIQAGATSERLELRKRMILKAENGSVYVGAPVEPPTVEWVLVVPDGLGRIYVGWRMPGGGEASRATFNVYRSQEHGSFVKLNSEPVTATTDYLDAQVEGGVSYRYTVRSIVDGREGQDSAIVEVTAASKVDAHQATEYLSIPDLVPSGPRVFATVRVGYIDDDGLLDFLASSQHYTPIDPDDPTSMLVPDEFPRMQAFRHSRQAPQMIWDEEKQPTLPYGDPGLPALWEGTWTLYDLDGDGQSEVIAQDCDLPAGMPADGDCPDGHYELNILDGISGAERASVHLPRANSRYQRYLAVAYLDGQHPHVLVQMGGSIPEDGIKLVAYRLEAGDHGEELVPSWPSPDGATHLDPIGGAHSLTVVDYDGDGADEVLVGAQLVRGSDGMRIWAAERSGGIWHPDRVFAEKGFRPDKPGYELLAWYERSNGISLHSLHGDLIWDSCDPASDFCFNHNDAGWCADLMPENIGLECKILVKEAPPPWDPKTLFLLDADTGELERFFHDGVPIRWSGADQDEIATVTGEVLQWQGGSFQSIATTSSTHDLGKMIVADIIGDYREEILIIGIDGTLRVHTNTTPNRRKKLSPWEDRRYRVTQARTGKFW